MAPAYAGGPGKRVCVFVCDDDVSIVINDKGKIKMTVNDDNSNCVHNYANYHTVQWTTSEQ